ncbi:MAG TPA: amidohydrolase family protein [Ignavibacteriales bacterium]|nr:amidohydrolase family protein [Ignavibacteriales bacterium]HOL80785.1 amidohydrolase family protein [Ignavibacteriales bacterium]HOM66200.1 amidohydrolase family protein [Ignavibacteriales bacterium]HPP33221.1 amidohydrolase family protein [Ignavibacteriales bacterium]
MSSLELTKTYLIRNALIPYNDEIVKKDLLIENGKIAEISDKIRKQITFDVIDSKGQFLFPGFIDIHTHLNCKIGKFWVADNYESGTEIAVDNGITTLFNFITQSKVEDPSITYLSEIESLKKQKVYCDVYFHFTPFKENYLEVLSKIDNNFIKIIKLYTTYKQAGLYYSYKEIEEIFKKFKNKNFTYLIHCEDEEQLNKDIFEVVEFSKPYSHAIARSKSAEIIAVREILELAKKYKQKVHFVHISTPQAAIDINKAKSQGVDVSCETCPQYLILHDELLSEENGHIYVCSPPLRSKNIVKKNRELLVNEIFDLVATDHCAFLKKDKDNWQKDFRNIPNGLPGIGALPHVVFNLFDDFSHNNLLKIYRLLCENPAKVTGIYPKKGKIEIGSDASFVCFKVFKHNTVKIRSTYQDCYDPYENFSSKLKINFVISNNRLFTKSKNDGEK